MSIDTKAIMAEIHANTAKLDACAKPHEFEIDRLQMLGKRTCKKCGGKVQGLWAIWYERGLKDAKQ